MTKLILKILIYALLYLLGLHAAAGLGIYLAWVILKAAEWFLARS